MKVGQYCSKQVICVDKEQTPLEAAHVMRKHHVGDVVIVENKGNKVVPIGIVTDRDITIEIVAEEVDPMEVRALDICRKTLVVVNENDDLGDCVTLLKREGVRRAPVIDNEGFLVGIITTDDIVEILAKQLGALADLLSYQPEREMLMTQ